MDTPIALTDQQMLTVTEVARRLFPHLRGQYLQIVANLLSDVVVGDASVHRAAHRSLEMVELRAWQRSAGRHICRDMAVKISLHFIAKAAASRYPLGSCDKVRQSQPPPKFVLRQSREPSPTTRARYQSRVMIPFPKNRTGR
jgi:hypothetical protein